MNKYYDILVMLLEVLNEEASGKNEYNIVDCAVGYIPYKNGENKAEEVGIDFHLVARWLLSEMEQAENL